MKFEVRCGTRNPAELSIDTDDYGTCNLTKVDDQARAAAAKLLHDTMNDEDFADDGHRNHDAVNGCIALHVLGYNALEWFESFCEEQKKNYDQWFESDLNKFIEHVERVSEYLDSWGPEGYEFLALDYAI